MADDDNKCGHDGCECAVGTGEKFCSDHCRNASEQDITEISCDCSHSGLRDTVAKKKSLAISARLFEVRISH